MAVRFIYDSLFYLVNLGVTNFYKLGCKNSFNDFIKIDEFYDSFGEIVKNIVLETKPNEDASPNRSPDGLQGDLAMTQKRSQNYGENAILSVNDKDVAEQVVNLGNIIFAKEFSEELKRRKE